MQHYLGRNIAAELVFDKNNMCHEVHGCLTNTALHAIRAGTVSVLYTRDINRKDTGNTLKEESR